MYFAMNGGKNARIFIKFSLKILKNKYQCKRFSWGYRNDSPNFTYAYTAGQEKM